MASTIAAGTSAGTAIAISGDTSGSLQLQTNGTTTAVTIDTSQNVGIGTSSPGAKLDVSNGTMRASQTSTASTSIVYATNSGNNSVGFWKQGSTAGSYGVIAAENGAVFNSSGELCIVNDASSKNIIFANNGAANERARIDSSGNLLVGTTTAAPTAPFNGTAVAGVFRTIATSGSVTNGGNTTLFTISVDTVYLVTVQTQNASGLSTTAIVRYVTGGNPVATTTLYADNAGFAVTVSGTAVRITNNLGGNVAFAHSSVRIY